MNGLLMVIYNAIEIIGKECDSAELTEKIGCMMLLVLSLAFLFYAKTNSGGVGELIKYFKERPVIIDLASSDDDDDDEEIENGELPQITLDSPPLCPWTPLVRLSRWEGDLVDGVTHLIKGDGGGGQVEEVARSMRRPWGRPRGRPWGRLRRQ